MALKILDIDFDFEAIFCIFRSENSSFEMMNLVILNAFNSTTYNGIVDKILICETIGHVFESRGFPFFA